MLQGHSKICYFQVHRGPLEPLLVLIILLTQRTDPETIHSQAMPTFELSGIEIDSWIRCRRNPTIIEENFLGCTWDFLDIHGKFYFQLTAYMDIRWEGGVGISRKS